MKRLLYIGVGFHEYDKYIVETLRESFDVSTFGSSEFHTKHPLLYSLVKYSPSFVKKANASLISQNINNLKDKNFDYVFIIKGSNLSDLHLETLKAHHPNAKFILYLWDAWEMINNRDVLKKHIPTIYSFDSEDCKKYGFILRPLFYLRETQPEHKKYDISFVGNGHSNRFSIIQKFKDLCLKNGYRYKFVVNMGLTAVVKTKLFSNGMLNKDRDIISPGNIPYSEYLQITRDSKVILDIHYPKQSGLTIRTIEALASGARVITTNRHIVEYKNIPTELYFVWDQEDYECLKEFISKPYSKFKLDSSFSVHTFINDMIN